MYFNRPEVYCSLNFFNQLKYRKCVMLISFHNFVAETRYEITIINSNIKEI